MGLYSATFCMLPWMCWVSQAQPNLQAQDHSTKKILRGKPKIGLFKSCI